MVAQFWKKLFKRRLVMVAGSEWLPRMFATLGIISSCYPTLALGQSVLTPICPPAGTVKKYAASTETSHGSRDSNADVCTFDINGSNQERLLGYMDVPSENIKQARDAIYAIVSGDPSANSLTFQTSDSYGINKETITRIPGKTFTMTDGKTYTTRGILRHMQGMLNGKTYEEAEYFPVIGKFVFMTALEKDATINPGNWWGMKTTSFVPVAPPEAP